MKPGLGGAPQDHRHHRAESPVSAGATEICAGAPGYAESIERDLRAEIAQLAHERDAAAAASAAKSRYLANVSHEIRAPLNAIYGYAQLLERGSGVDPTEAARVIRRSAEHLTDLVDGLLDISLVEHGVMRVASDVVRLSSFLDQIERMFRPAATAKGLAFSVEVRGRLPECVRTDQKRLRQALINLVSNAIKFTPIGFVTLAVGFSGQVATFEVRDSGPGIAAEAQHRIFAPFDRGEQDAGTEGIGLGLPITRAIVQILGGDLDLDSTPGQGSCFRVRLMLPEVAPPREASVQARQKSAPIVGYEGARRKILVMDDDVRQLAFVRQALEDIGFDVATAPDGATALALADARHFDLALLDIAMAGPDGWQTAAALRQRHVESLRIVMLSANAHDRHGPPSGESPHDVFLVKPVEIATLFDTLGTQLNLAWLRADRPDATDAAVLTQPEASRIALPEAAKVRLGALRELLKIGYVRGIEAEIRALEAAAPQAQPLVATLYDCLDRFDLAGLARTIEDY